MTGLRVLFLQELAVFWSPSDPWFPHSTLQALRASSRRFSKSPGPSTVCAPSPLIQDSQFPSSWQFAFFLICKPLDLCSSCHWTLAWSTFSVGTLPVLVRLSLTHHEVRPDSNNFFNAFQSRVTHQHALPNWLFTWLFATVFTDKRKANDSPLPVGGFIFLGP